MKSALKSMSNTKLQMNAHKYPMPNPFSDEISRRSRKRGRKALKVAK
jgi:hypothetical protein